MDHREETRQELTRKKDRCGHSHLIRLGCGVNNKELCFTGGVDENNEKKLGSSYYCVSCIEKFRGLGMVELIGQIQLQEAQNGPNDAQVYMQIHDRLNANVHRVSDVIKNATSLATIPEHEVLEIQSERDTKPDADKDNMTPLDKNTEAEDGGATKKERKQIDWARCVVGHREYNEAMGFEDMTEDESGEGLESEGMDIGEDEDEMEE
ncbi:uncharacterized protein PAC_15042 [Phialocephala subalpina]|uniref:Uncharacterized protein n=1 Tax=Phialocephala subalpina TaxID=576137 RepID=A0A1L7XJC0_9HELO|nr:uncharacterized protein PAC_15042 [Phialocephala subalpina]